MAVQIILRQLNDAVGSSCKGGRSGDLAYIWNTKESQAAFVFKVHKESAEEEEGLIGRLLDVESGSPKSKLVTHSDENPQSALAPYLAIFKISLPAAGKTLLIVITPNLGREQTPHSFEFDSGYKFDSIEQAQLYVNGVNAFMGSPVWDMKGPKHRGNRKYDIALDVAKGRPKMTNGISKFEEGFSEPDFKFKKGFSEPDFQNFDAKKRKIIAKSCFFHQHFIKIFNFHNFFFARNSKNFVLGDGTKGVARNFMTVMQDLHREKKRRDEDLPPLDNLQYEHVDHIYLPEERDAFREKDRQRRERQDRDKRQGRVTQAADG